MSGLDPVGRKQMRDLIRDIRDAGTSVIFSSHILSDAEAVCDRIVILAGGKVQASLFLAEHNHIDDYEITVLPATDQVRSVLAEVSTKINQLDNGNLVLVVPELESVNHAIDLIRHHGSSVVEVTPRRSSLEEVFLKHTNAAQLGK